MKPRMSHAAAVLRLYYVITFISFGVFLPFLPPWLEGLGIGGLGLGVIFALRPTLAVFSPVLFGVVADRFGLRGALLRLACIASGLSMAGMALLPLFGIPLGFFWVLVGMTLFSFFRAPMVSIADVATLEGAKSRYGTIRLFGSSGFLIAALFAGYLMDPARVSLFPAVIAVCMLFAAGVAFAVPGSILASQTRTLSSRGGAMTEPRDIAKLIDHAVLRPTTTSADVLAGAVLSKRHGVAAFCVHSKAVAKAREGLAGADVALAAVVGFPHGNTTTQLKQAEAAAAIAEGAREIDMVIDIGGACEEAWDRVSADIRDTNRTVVDRGGLLKVIFETDYLEASQIIRLCEICAEIGVAFVKTSTGFGGRGATEAHVALMRAHTPKSIGIKASGDIRTLQDLKQMVAAGATRIGTSSTEAILREVGV